MAFGVQDFQDLVDLLEQRPEWRAELRQLLLTQELLDLPAVVRGLAEQVRALAEAQRRTEEQVRALAEAQQQTNDNVRGLAEQVRALAEAQQRTEEEVRTLARGQHELREQVGWLRGEMLELRYREHAGAYFDDLVRRAAPLSSQQLVDVLDEGEADGHLAPEERRDVLLADLVVRGRRRADGVDVYVVVEVSAGLDRDDVERAARRAGLLGRLGPALAAVAGARITREAEALADSRGVWRVLDGRVTAPPA